MDPPVPPRPDGLRRGRLRCRLLCTKFPPRGSWRIGARQRNEGWVDLSG